MLAFSLCHSQLECPAPHGTRPARPRNEAQPYHPCGIWMNSSPNWLVHQSFCLSLFPDSKEVSESMGVFDAARCHLDLTLPPERPPNRPLAVQCATALCLLAMARRRVLQPSLLSARGWQCFSIDPIASCRGSQPLPPSMLRRGGWQCSRVHHSSRCDDTIDALDERAKPTASQMAAAWRRWTAYACAWAHTGRASALGRAIVVLLHAHVTLADALAAVEADELVGVICCPCCNWHEHQATMTGLPPDAHHRPGHPVLAERGARVEEANV